MTFVTPASSMVTPYKCWATAIVVLLCVTTINWSLSRVLPASSNTSRYWIHQAARRLIKYAERRSLIRKLANCSESAVRAFPSGKQMQVLKFLARRLRNDINACFEDVILVRQDKLCFPPSEECHNTSANFTLRASKASLSFSCSVVYPRYGLFKLRNRLMEVFLLLVIKSYRVLSSSYSSSVPRFTRPSPVSCS